MVCTFLRISHVLFLTPTALLQRGEIRFLRSLLERCDICAIGGYICISIIFFYNATEMNYDLSRHRRRSFPGENRLPQSSAAVLPRSWMQRYSGRSSVRTLSEGICRGRKDMQAGHHLRRTAMLSRCQVLRHCRGIPLRTLSERHNRRRSKVSASRRLRPQSLLPR